MPAAARSIAAVCALAASSLVLNAVPAKRVYIDYEQADGSIVKVQRVGDEFFSYFIDENGAPLMRSEADGCLRYVVLDPATGKAVLSDARISADSGDCRPAEFLLPRKI